MSTIDYAAQRAGYFKRISMVTPTTPVIHVSDNLSLTEENKVVLSTDPTAVYTLVTAGSAFPADLAKQLGIPEGNFAPKH